MALALTAYFSRGYWLPLVGVEPSAPELGTGDVQLTLTWESTNDLDLWVTDPAGESIFFDHPSADSGGQLDVDANADCQDLTTHPVENIFWPTGDAPLGKYLVEVQYYKQCENPAPIDFHIRMLVDGEVSEFDGTIASQDDRQLVTSFER